jgi:hypothetical protein
LKPNILILGSGVEAAHCRTGNVIMKRHSLFVGVLLCILGTTAPIVAQDFLTNGLVAYYPFNGNANDESGNGKNGTVQGAVLTRNRFGVGSSAYHFDGLSSKILIPETVFSPSNASITISLWVTTDGGSYSDNQHLFVKGGVNGTMMLQFLNGQMLFGPKLQTSATWYWATAPILSNSVMHLVGVYAKGANASLYVNGALADSAAVPDDNLFIDPSYPLISAIGIYDFTGDPFGGFRGTIDDVRIYTNALTAAQVQQLYVYESIGPGCRTHRATATAQISGGSIVGANIADVGCGYTNTPLVAILGGGGTGATATAVVSNGAVVSVAITNPGSGYTSAPAIYIYSPMGLQVDLAKAVKPSFSDLLIGTNYQLQLSADLVTWTNQGSPFTATAPTMVYPQYFDADWGSLFFRVHSVP